MPHPNIDSENDQDQPNLFMYDDESIENLKKDYQEIRQSHDDFGVKLNFLHKKLSDPKAQEYSSHGVGRRFTTIKRCIDNIFKLFPLDQKQNLDREIRLDITINLQSFILNIYGILDNMAWVLLSEKLTDLPSKKNVGLFHKKSMEHFNKDFHYCPKQLFVT